jgi:D-tyrosyl-tRNA(Tyr) deacylase
MSYSYYMRLVLQRVSRASVEVEGAVAGAIGNGLLVFLGVAREDRTEDADYLAEKLANLRIFPDDAGKMNRSVLESGGSVLVVSQFTLYGDCRKGRRPSFDEAADPEKARSLYEYFVERIRGAGLTIATGVFQAHMLVSLENDGPVTLIVESKKNG